MRTRHASPLRTSLLWSIPLLAALAACSDPEGGARTPTNLEPRMAGVAGGEIVVTVTDADGKTPAAGVTVVPFNPTSGPYLAGESLVYAGQETGPDGVATIQGFPQGPFCVTVRDVPLAAFNPSGELIAPPATDAAATGFASAGARVGVITGKGAKPVPFEPNAFATYCASDAAPLKLGRNRVSVKLSFLGPDDSPPASVNFQVLDLRGLLTSIPSAWAVYRLSFDQFPWIDSSKKPAGDVFPGLLISAIEAGQFQAQGLQNNLTVDLQSSLFDADDGQGRLTATLHDVTAGTSLTDAVQATPLVCKVGKSAEPAADASVPVDVIGVSAGDSIKLGFGADPGLAVNATTFSLWYYQKQTAATQGTLYLRFSNGPTSQAQADYICDGTGKKICRVVSTRVSGQDSLGIHVFGAQKGDKILVTWVVDRVAPAVQFVDLQLQAGFDKWPNASRDNQDAAYARLFNPALDNTACDAGLGSDDRYWLN